MVHRIVKNILLFLIASTALVSAQTYNQFPPPGMAYTNHLTTNSVVAGGSFNATGTTIPANGIYLPSANTLGITTNSIQAISISSAQTVTFNSGTFFVNSATSQSRAIIGSAAGNPSYLEFTINGSVVNYWGVCGAINDLITGCAANDAVLNNISATGNVLIGTNAIERLRITNTGDIDFKQKLFVSATAPTISSGFGTSPSIVSNNGPSSFSVNIGTGAVASSGVIGLPAAATGWACSVAEITSPATDATSQTGSSTTSITVTNYARTTGVAHAWTASDILELSCWPN